LLVEAGASSRVAGSSAGVNFTENRC